MGWPVSAKRWPNVAKPPTGFLRWAMLAGVDLVPSWSGDPLSKLKTVLLSGAALIALVAAQSTPASASPALTAATAYKCGSQCNGRSPSWVIPSNGVQCKNSATLIGTGHPAFDMKSPVDYSVTVRAYYSTVCQTEWATVTVSASSPDYTCGWDVERTVSPYYGKSGPCLGHSVTTAMFDDANGGKVAGYVQVITQWSTHGGYWRKSY